jgi:hypothetical protein
MRNGLYGASARPMESSRSHANNELHAAAVSSDKWQMLTGGGYLTLQ